MQSRQRPKSVRRRFRTVWQELEYLCARIHTLWYVKENQRRAANAYLGRLERLLADLPENDMAILRAEGLALLHELKGDSAGAIKYRRREIQLMERLLEDVNAHDYDEKMKASILVGRDEQALQERRAILKSLRKSVSVSRNG
jgi:hypothetical protein